MSDPTVKWLVEVLRDSHGVKRFHTVHTINSETISAHQHMVAMLCFIVTAGNPTVNLLMAALTHDLPEIESGDVPAPTKRLLSEEAQKTLRVMDAAYLMDLHVDGHWSRLTEDESRLLKLADRLAGMLFCVLEAQMGNQLIKPAYKNFRNYALESISSTSIERNTFQTIEQLWEDTW